MFPPPRILLLALKWAVLEMLSIGSILTLYLSPSQNCYWSRLLQLSHVTFTFFAFQHFFSHWTVSHPEDGSNTFLPNVTTNTTNPPYFQHPLCKLENLYDNSCCHLSNSCYWRRHCSLRRPKGWKGHEEPAWECCMELSSCTVTVTMDKSVCWNWALQDHKVCVVLCDLQLVQENA